MAFRPFRGMAAGMEVADGFTDLPQAPRIDFELHDEAWQQFKSVLGGGYP